MRCWPVKHFHSTAVSARRVRSGDAVPSKPAVVDSVSDLGILKYAQVHVGLGHPPQRRLQYPVMSVMNVVGAEPNRHPPSTHPPPTDAFLSPDPAAIPARAYLPFCLSWSRFAPSGLPSPFPSLFPSTFSPLPDPCCSTWHGVIRSVLTQGK